MKRWHYLGVALAAAITVGTTAVLRLHATGATPPRAPYPKVQARTRTHPRPAAVAVPAGRSARLPMAADFRLVPVWTLKAQPVYVNASVTPVVFLDAQRPGNLRPFLNTLGRIPGPHPVVFVMVGFPAETLHAALRQAAVIAAARLAGAPTYALQGPWAQYTHTLPALAYLSVTAAGGRILPISGHISYAELAAAFGRLRSKAPRPVLAARPSNKHHHA